MTTTRKVATGESKNILGAVIVRAGAVIEASQKWQAKGENAILQRVAEGLQILQSPRETEKLFSTVPIVIVRKTPRFAPVWRRYYEENHPDQFKKYPSEFDFSKVPIPEAGDEYKWFDCIPRHSIIGEKEALSGGVLSQGYRVSYCYYDLNKDIRHDLPNRDAWDIPYIIRCKPNVEADEDLKGLSAEKIGQQGINTVACRERIILGRFWMWYPRKKIILDRKNITLDVSSRDSDGVVPSLRWCAGGVCVGGYGVGDAGDDLRARRAVSVS